MNMKTNKYAFLGLCMAAASCAATFTGCEDFFEQDSNQLVYAEGGHLNQPTDTVYSMMGILQKMQAIADRTVLLGELRGDLVDLGVNTPADLRNLSLFNLSDSSNVYNQPRDYYAVINNCNYFIANADTAMRDNRNEMVFMREFAAAKTFRAWTYLQLVLAYGRVPFVTEPVLSSADLERDYPWVELSEICDYFINDLTPTADENIPLFTGLSTDNRLIFIPTKLLLGDLCLYANRYQEAASWYYRYISERNGEFSAYPVTTSSAAWGRNDDRYSSWSDGFSSLVTSEGYSNDGELITLIPCPTDIADPNYSQLRNIFSSTHDNEYDAPVAPSEALLELSRKQTYCNYSTEHEVTLVPADATEYPGDLRLYSVYNESSINYDHAYKPYQAISKNNSSNVHVYRRAMVYLRLAEALNRAGYPRFAFAILSTGVNDSIVRSDVLPYCHTAADSAYAQSFSFPENRYIVRRVTPNAGDVNTIGIHSRGSGWAEFNPEYAFPVAPEGTADTLQWQITRVEDLIIDECALEMAFEGQRFGDLMRVAMRRGTPSYLADKVYARRGADATGVMQGLIARPLDDPHSWYMSWQGQIGY